MVLFGNFTLNTGSNFCQMGYYMKLVYATTPFYSKLDDTQRSQSMAIVQNVHMTWDQISDELINWGQKQPVELLEEMKEFGLRFMEVLDKLYDYIRSYKFSSAAEPFGSKLKAITTNHSLTPLEHDKMANEVLNSASPQIQTELSRFLLWMNKVYIEMVLSLY